MTVYSPRKVVAPVAATVVLGGPYRDTLWAPRDRVTVRGNTIPRSGTGEPARPTGVSR